jgi:type IV pilus assembly protein PilA
MVVVAIIGVLAAVAIPAFMKYLSKAKTAEARQAVKKIYDGARAYYMDPNGAAKFGDVTFPRFPDSVGPTPSTSCCNNSGNKCPVDATQWTDARWLALAFAMEEPHYYWYSFDAVNSSDKSFTAIAEGDLDCDGRTSYFSMYGEINSDYADGPAGTASLFRQNELE